MDDRFSGLNHFYYAVAFDRARKLQVFHDNIELYREEGDFTEEEKLQYLLGYCGIFPMSTVVNDQLQKRIDELMIPPISEFDTELQVCWFIPREVLQKKTKNGKLFYVVKVIDSNSEENTIKCWGVDPKKDLVYVNRPYMARLQWDAQWGFSTRSVRKSFRMLA